MLNLSKIILLLVCSTFVMTYCNKPVEVVELKSNTNLSKSDPNDFKLWTDEKMSIAELFKKVENAKESEFLFPCDLNVSLGGKENLARLRNQWFKNEDDNSYRLALKSDFRGFRRYNCVCPGVCVVVVVDDKKTSPNNFGVLVFNQRLKSGYSWLMKDVDLSDMALTWSSSTPHFYKVGQDGKPLISPDNKMDGCRINWSAKEKKYLCPKY